MAQALIDRIRAGDEDAVTELAAAYSGRIHWIAFRYLHNHEDAEEIVQDVLLTVVRKAAAFRGDAALSTWIYRIAFNATMTRVRRARPEQQAASLADVRALEIVDQAARPDARAYRVQLRRKLRRAILSLPAVYRAPVVLRDLRGLSTAEAGTVLAITGQTLKSRLHWGHVMLRHRLSAFSAVAERQGADSALSSEVG